MQASAINLTPPTPSTSSNSMTVLLVEDDSIVRELVAHVLQSEGYFVLKARHSAEALYYCGEYAGPLHLLLTDFCMAPHMNGRQLAGTIRLSRPDIPVLYMSGAVDDEVLVQEVETGMAYFLPKPFNPHFLLECVRRAMAPRVNPV